MDTSGFCQSCGMPLGAPDAKGLSDRYCAYCTDEVGDLKTREEVKEGIVAYMMEWQKIDEATALKRAEHYMKSMPEWADD